MILAVVLVFTVLTSGYEVINISRDWNFDEQGIFIMNSLTFYVFDKEENGDKTLTYECTLDSDNNWQVDNGYVDISFNPIANITHYDFHNGKCGSIYYSIYQPISGIYIEESNFSSCDNVVFSLKKTYNQQEECIKIQGYVLNYIINLSEGNNWTNVFSDGSILKIYPDHIFLMDPNGLIAEFIDGLGFRSDARIPDGGGGGCGNCTYCPCWTYPLM
jgi:hypothetical protein